MLQKVNTLSCLTIAYDIVSILERVVKCYMSANTTLENTYKITKICLAELKSLKILKVHYADIMLLF